MSRPFFEGDFMSALIDRRTDIAFRLHFAERLNLNIAQIAALSVELHKINKQIEEIAND